MYELFDSLANVILDRSPDELIGAVIVALGLSLAFAGVDFLARRKLGEARMLTVGLMIGANLISMCVAAGYLVHMTRMRSTKATEQARMAATRPYLVLVESTFRAADKNQDGLLSSDEASFAAAEFVRRVDPTGKGMVDPFSLEQSLSLSGFHSGRRPIGGPMPFPPRPGLGQRRGLRPRQDELVQPAGSPSRASSEEHGQSPSGAAEPSDL